MTTRNLGRAGLKLVGAFLTDWRTKVQADPSTYSLHDWGETENGLEPRLPCAGLR